jgi:hypothetical protein
MPEAGGRSRLFAPPALVLAVAVGSCAAYDVAPPAVANVVILPYAACLLLAPALLFPWLRLRGAGAGPATAGALVVQAAWLGKELWALSAVFPPGETLFYALGPVPLGLLALALFQIAVAELWLRRRAGRPARGPALALTALLILGGIAAWAARGNGGREIFYGYVALHARLFGG